MNNSQLRDRIESMEQQRNQGFLRRSAEGYENLTNEEIRSRQLDSNNVIELNRIEFNRIRVQELTEAELINIDRRGIANTSMPINDDSEIETINTTFTNDE